MIGYGSYLDDSRGMVSQIVELVEGRLQRRQNLVSFWMGDVPRVCFTAPRTKPIAERLNAVLLLAGVGVGQMEGMAKCRFGGGSFRAVIFPCEICLLGLMAR
jgi:hypothetical protein